MGCDVGCSGKTDRTRVVGAVDGIIELITVPAGVVVVIAGTKVVGGAVRKGVAVDGDDVVCRMGLTMITGDMVLGEVGAWVERMGLEVTVGTDVLIDVGVLVG
jgi:hypothetical protein